MATFKGITLPDGETYLPEGGGSDLSAGYELIVRQTTEEAVKLFSVELDLSSYGIIYFDIEISPSETPYTLVWCLSENENFNWGYIVSFGEVPISYPYYVKGTIITQQEKLNSYVKSATRYAEEASYFNGKGGVSSKKFNHMAIVSNSEGIMIPAGTIIEIWGIKKEVA